MKFEISNRRFGKTTEHKRQLGESVYKAVYEGGPRVFLVGSAKGVFQVKITKKRMPKGTVRFGGSNI